MRVNYSAIIYNDYAKLISRKIKISSETVEKIPPGNTERNLFHYVYHENGHEEVPKFYRKSDTTDSAITRTSSELIDNSGIGRNLHKA